MAEFELVNHKFQNETTLHIHLCSFQSTDKGSNAQRVSAPTTITLSTIANILQALNCFSHSILFPQTNTNQNIAKSFIPLSKYKNLKLTLPVKRDVKLFGLCSKNLKSNHACHNVQGQAERTERVSVLAYHLRHSNFLVV